MKKLVIIIVFALLALLALWYGRNKPKPIEKEEMIIIEENGIDYNIPNVELIDNEIKEVK